MCACMCVLDVQNLVESLSKFLVEEYPGWLLGDKHCW